MTDSQHPSASTELTEPLVSEASTTVAASDLADGKPVSGRVLLGQEQLVYVTDDEERCIDLADVTDVAVDYTPTGLEQTFTSSVGVSYRDDDQERISVVQLPGRQQLEFAYGLLDGILTGSSVYISHPTRIGGRATNNPAQRGRLKIDSGRLLVKVEDGSVFRIILANLSTVERGKQPVPDGMNEALILRYTPEDKEITTKLSTGDARLFTLFDRRVRHGFKRIKKRVRKTTPTGGEQDVLTALYLRTSGRDIETMVDKRPSTLEDILSRLELHNLVVRSNGNTELTEMGRLAIESVINCDAGAGFAMSQ